MNNKVCVVGLGYVGLPLAALCAIKGHDVIGLETNQFAVDKINQGLTHIKDIEVERLVEAGHLTGRFKATTDVNAIASATIYLICVPTPVDENHDPDMLPLYSAVDAIAPFLKKDALVVVESTVFPGTCEQEVIPRLESLTDMKAGEDFHVAHCPERVNPGDPFWTSENIPRVVGATSEKGVKQAAEFYASILGGRIFDVRAIKSSMNPKFSLNDDGSLNVSQVPLGSVTMMRSIRDAEAVKAMENTVRDVNIAFVNELAKISDVLGLDVVDIIDGMATKPFGKGPFYPGVGVGGHCIAVDPEWLKAASKKAGYMPEMIQLARSTNNGMPEHTVSLLQNMLNDRGLPLKGTQVLVLGVAYKKNVDDPRESPFYEVKELLEKKGAHVDVFDSWIGFENTVESLDEGLKKAKAVLIVTEHSDVIGELKTKELENLPLEVLVDGRNCLKAEDVRAQGVLYSGIGRK